MPDDLKTLRHKRRRVLWGLLPVLVGLMVVHILMVNDVIGWWGWLVLALTAALIIVIAVWQNRTRVRDLRPEDGGFVAPVYTGWPGLLAFPSIFLMNLGVITLRPPLDSETVGASTALLALGFAGIVIIWWGLRRWKRQVLVIRPAGLVIIAGVRPKTIAWDEITGAVRTGRVIQIAVRSPGARFTSSEVSRSSMSTWIGWPRSSSTSATTRRLGPPSARPMSWIGFAGSRFRLLRDRRNRPCRVRACRTSETPTWPAPLPT